MYIVPFCSLRSRCKEFNKTELASGLFVFSFQFFGFCFSVDLLCCVFLTVYFSHQLWLAFLLLFVVVVGSCCRCCCCLVALDSLVIWLLRDLRRFVGHDKYTKTFSGFFVRFLYFGSPLDSRFFVHSLCWWPQDKMPGQQPGRSRSRSWVNSLRHNLLLLLLLLALIGTQSSQEAAHPQQIIQVRSKQLWQHSKD